MGYNLFQRRGLRDAATSEFAATVATLPPAVESGVPDSGLFGPSDSDVADSQIAESALESLPAPDALDIAPDSPDTFTETRPTLSHVGRYALKSKLGEGGLGQVHEAWDPLLSRAVAVKTLQFNLPPATRASLDGLILNEARAAAGLSHNHIVTVHDAGLSAHGVYIAMERLHGRDLRQALAGGWLPSPRLAAQLVRRVADALAYAHHRGVVHCDIKPGNIFLVGRDKPKVLDFGIARVAHGPAAPVLDGLVAGSPHYLAPEQLQGGPIDARVDIHALGAVFYELLTRRKAFGGDSVAQITTAVLTHHPPPAHELRPGVPEGLSAIAARAMAREPADRFASAGDMAAALRRWCDEQSAPDPLPLAKPTAGQAAAAPPARRLPRSAWAGLAVVLVVGTVMALSGRVREGAAAMPVVQTPVQSSVAALPSLAVAFPVVSFPVVYSPTLSSPATGEAPVAVALTVATAATPAPESGATLHIAAADSAKNQARPATKPGASLRTRATHALPARDAAPIRAAAPLATGAVQLAISPWGRVEVDGVTAGTTPPLTRLTLPEGTHTVVVHNADFPPFSTEVQVQADKPVTLRHRFAQ